MRKARVEGVSAEPPPVWTIHLFDHRALPSTPQIRLSGTGLWSSRSAQTSAIAGVRIGLSTDAASPSRSACYGDCLLVFLPNA